MKHYQRDLVLVGGGHSHVIALRMLAMQQLPGTRITLISPDTHSPYSGMLPGLVAGRYEFDDIHIDLQRLCAWAGARFVRATVQSLDPVRRELLFVEDRPALCYDLLSIDIGSEPNLAPLNDSQDSRNVAALVTPVKPIATFYGRWLKFCEALAPGKDIALGVVGGGVGSVEISLAIARWLQVNKPGTRVRIELLSAAPRLLGEYGDAARRSALAALAGSGVTICTDFRVAKLRRENDTVIVASNSGQESRFAQVLWCTAASAAGWPAAAGLACDAQGFISVNENLQSLSHANVFAAGDIADFQLAPRPKAGVFAVRQGPILAENLRRHLVGRELKPFKPQSGFLSLLSTGDGSAIGNWRGVGFNGDWVWRLKDWIDRGFMRKFEELPERDMDSAVEAVRNADQGAAEFDMRCGGCGGKLPADMLARVLAELADSYPETVAAAESGDDAARIDVPGGGTLMQSVDVLRELIDDPYVMGRIAVNHALSDLYAMGAQPLSAQAIVHLPYGGEQIQERDLLQLMTGAVRELASAGCALVGGHSLEGAELSLGFVVNGRTIRELTTKAGARPGDRLLLAKPLGLGVIHAAHRQLKLNSRDLVGAEAEMLLSNAGAAEVAREFSATAVTDITGFGLAGHLLEMLAGQSLTATVNLSTLPVLPGVYACFEQGLFSTAQAANARAAAHINNWPDFETQLEAAVLFDPQTSGGLLLAVPESLADPCLEALLLSGYDSAAIIGQVHAGGRGINLI